MLCGSEHERERGGRPVESNAIGNFVTQVHKFGASLSCVGGERIQRKLERDHPPEVRARLVVNSIREKAEFCLPTTDKIYRHELNKGCFLTPRSFDPLFPT